MPSNSDQPDLPLPLPADSGPLRKRAARPVGCAWCGELPIRDNLDGEDLCQSCCNKWAQGERN